MSAYDLYWFTPTKGERAKGAYKLDRLPKTAEQYREAAQRCANVTGTRRWAYSGPTALDWKAGDHWMVCFKPD